eukprot:363920-Chlamydomonas_euryale.AAC.6
MLIPAPHVQHAHPCCPCAACYSLHPVHSCGRAIVIRDPAPDHVCWWDDAGQADRAECATAHARPTPQFRWCMQFQNVFVSLLKCVEPSDAG